MQWKEEWFRRYVVHYPRGVWDDKQNQRKILDPLWKEFNINSTDPRGWGQISFKMLAERGCSSLLRHYGNSPIKMISGVYSGKVQNYDLNEINANGFQK